ncbi:MAG: hypothetical protein CFH42_00579 [Alphaproteobacteria bacterium MarineAlpha12_Bin1]|jgi:nucleoside-diphosphate-sugar epimerase|nr:MAG: hypothetical protein CFH42_00579 [Alphaproteobacteria bacterium MarineAlpha12_Bin1]|tara:strand:+ start:21027 stop:21902 length:876 start_codon:yes stop_codon:yes gene_type:complete
MPNPQTLFCFGFGYTAKALSNTILSKGWSVRGTTRHKIDQDVSNAKMFFFDRDKPLTNPDKALKGITHLLVSIPPDSIGDPVIDHHKIDLISQMEDLRWIGYLSTTGVYGDQGGAYVDENTQRNPKSIRSQIRAKIEDEWYNLWKHNGLPVHLFRLAGIYGPGRNTLEVLKKGLKEQVVKKGQVFNRIHVQDIASTLLASMNRPNPGGIYNVSDDEPASTQDVIAYACDLLGKKIPPAVPYERAKISEMARSFYEENKRVTNNLIKQELEVTLAYSNYRLGLQALLNEEKN